MAVALEQFVKQLEDSGVIAPGKLEDFVAAQRASQRCSRTRSATRAKQATDEVSGPGNLSRASQVVDSGRLYDRRQDRRGREWARCSRLSIGRWIDWSRSRSCPRRHDHRRRGGGPVRARGSAAARLSHSNIVIAHDSDESGGVHFLVMEHIDGADLSWPLVKKKRPDLCREGGGLRFAGRQGRLEYAHAKGVVHRDIKPANLLVDCNGTSRSWIWAWLGWKVASASDAAMQPELTSSGTIMGTVDYMAPREQRSTASTPTLVVVATSIAWAARSTTCSRAILRMVANH